MSTSNGIVHINKRCRTGLEVGEIWAGAEVCPGEVFAADFIMTTSGNTGLLFFVVFFYMLKALCMFRICYN